MIITDGPDCYPWREYFAIIPRTTIGGTRIFWTKAYKRRIWLADFHIEPIIQYATLFELLSNKDDISY